MHYKPYDTQKLSLFRINQPIGNRSVWEAGHGQWATFQIINNTTKETTQLGSFKSILLMPLPNHHWITWKVSRGSVCLQALERTINFDGHDVEITAEFIIQTRNPNQELFPQPEKIEYETHNFHMRNCRIAPLSLSGNSSRDFLGARVDEWQGVTDTLFLYR